MLMLMRKANRNRSNRSGVATPMSSENLLAAEQNVDRAQLVVARLEAEVAKAEAVAAKLEVELAKAEPMQLDCNQQKKQLKMLICKRDSKKNSL